MNPMLRIFVFLCAAFCAVPVQASKLSEGAAYKRDLIRAIEKADKIVVTEHSNQFDFYDYKISNVIPHDEVTYETVVLSEQDTLKFKKIVKAVPNEMPEAIAACLYDPHHTVRFFSGDKLMSTLDVCFGCGRERWNGTKHNPPVYFNEGMRKFIQGIGLKPGRKWKELAFEQLEKDKAKSAAD